MSIQEPGFATLPQALRAYLEARTQAPVALRETHISWVLLTGRLAFKLKKPVRLPFVDFSTPALRHRYCLEELRLNRRFAAPLYRAVLPVRGSPDAPTLGCEGKVIDHVLCMRRFPDGALLAERLAVGSVVPRQIDDLAARIADAHAAAPAVDPGSPHGAPLAIMPTARRLLDQLAAGHSRPLGLADIRTWLAGEAWRLRSTWASRHGGGRVRECHGDLHCANVVALGDDFVPFDCIEFDPALRWIDVISDIAFLTMDLVAHRRSDLSSRFLDAYLQRSGDWEGLRVLRWYEVERALVRAVVQRILAAGSTTASASAQGADYLGCARGLAGAHPMGPRLMITFGLSGSGKSTLAQALLESAGALRLRSDVERKRLFGLRADQRPADTAMDLYTVDATRRTYEHLARSASTALEAGYPVIVDAAFLKHSERMDFREIARGRGVPFTILHCHAPAAVLEARLSARAAEGRDPSDADVRVLHRQLRTHEPLQQDESAWTIDVDTSRPVDVHKLLQAWSGTAPTT